MRDADTAAFAAMLSDVWGLVGKVPNEGQAALFFRALSAYSIETVRAAFDAHVKDPQRGRFAPLPADVIAQIEARTSDDGRPNADEAWSIAVAARDERATIVWTAEVSEAWGIALPVLDLGDEVGARMAFRDAYTRLVAVARRDRRPIAWQASLGHDAAGRQEALEAAVRAGKLPREELLAIPAPDTVGGLTGLLAGTSAPEHIRAKLREIADRHHARDQL